MVKYSKDKNQHHVTSMDNNGRWRVSLHKDGKQLQIASGIEGTYSGDETFIDTDKAELTAIRDMLNKVIETL